jgi:hypothetical protein
LGYLFSPKSLDQWSLAASFGYEDGDLSNREEIAMLLAVAGAARG